MVNDVYIGKSPKNGYIVVSNPNENNQKVICYIAPPFDGSNIEDTLKKAATAIHKRGIEHPRFIGFVDESIGIVELSDSEMQKFQEDYSNENNF